MLNSILVILCLIAVSAFFSISEISLAASRKIKLKLLADEGNINASRILKMQENPGMFFTVVQIGLNAVAILGGIVGGILVYVLFKDQFDATEDPGTKLGVFSTGPSVPNTGRNILQEAIATFVLVFAICGMNQVPGLDAGMGKLLVFGIIVSIGMSLGGLTGYALNPARDLGPRIAHAILPISGKGDSNFKYGLVVPIAGPILGGIVAVLLYNAIPW